MLLRVLAVLQLLGAARAVFGDQQGVRMTLTDEGDAGSDEVLAKTRPTGFGVIDQIDLNIETKTYQPHASLQHGRAATIPSFCDPSKSPYVDQGLRGKQLLDCYPHWHTAELARAQKRPCEENLAFVFFQNSGLGDSGSQVTGTLQQAMKLRNLYFVSFEQKDEGWGIALDYPFDWDWAKHHRTFCGTANRTEMEHIDDFPEYWGNEHNCMMSSNKCSCACQPWQECQNNNSHLECPNGDDLQVPLEWAYRPNARVQQLVNATLALKEQPGVDMLIGLHVRSFFVLPAWVDEVGFRSMLLPKN